MKEAPSYKGYEGGAQFDEDWLLVDCYDIVVHIMLPSKFIFMILLSQSYSSNIISIMLLFSVTRSAINLESHWEAKHRPIARYHPDADDYEEELERLLDKHPVPDDYAEMIMRQSELIQESSSSDKFIKNSIKAKKVSKF